MRNYDPTDKYDVKTAKEYNLKPWMLDLLALNPDYNSWGPGEDYMWNDNGGWGASVTCETWNEFGFDLDDLNEVVNFHFTADRPSKNCEECDQTGYNEATLAISNGFYAHSSPTGIGWNDQITQDEVDFLVKKGRLNTKDWNPETRVWINKKQKLTADEVNKAQRREGLGIGSFVMSHDAINRFYLIECRAKRLGVWGKCKACKGKGYIFTARQARVGLVVWVIHPRKGASRGVEIKYIEQSELPEVFGYLREAADRNAQRFAKIPEGIPRDKERLREQWLKELATPA